TNSTPYPTVQAERSKNHLQMVEGDTATFTYVLKANPYADRTIQIAPAHDGLKIVKGDGTKVDELTLTFTADNWDDAQTVTLSVEHDADRNDIQGRQDVNFTLGDKLTHASGSNATLTVQMLDDDAAPALTLSGASLTVDEGGSGTFTVRLAGRPSAAVTVVLVQPSNAANDDVTFTPASLAFTTSNWHTVQTVTVRATEDADGRDDTATISLSASGGDYGSVNDRVAVTVTDDEPGDLEFSTTRLDVDEGGSEIFTVKLTGQPSASVTLTLVQPDNTDVMLDTDTGTTGNQNTLTFTTGNWGTVQNVTVRAANDGDAGNDTATISLSASGGGYSSITGSVRITVRDDDDIDRVPANFNPITLADIAATEGSVVARSIA
ncbi:MAG: hypothetical protein ISN29_07915, partial [Gammaproteobacteria bacterium AqS3]|nr:hypothetical protein [Gammaproteobacteria bacterium AqS3]